MQITMSNNAIKLGHVIIGYYNKYDQDLIEKFDHSSLERPNYGGNLYNDTTLITKDGSLCMEFKSNDTWEIHEFDTKSYVPKDLIAKGKLKYDYLFEKLTDLEKPSLLKIRA